ncbi:Na+/H+ antiporter subunit E [Kaistia dalseonensis]|uniref:Multicomponent Na+:H+ antiporter subunit E n=1 Tax=Kaistia dalseonensis TaxID=410840 RepID=A0ABU0H817_9HYPH|nr:Na+/H+ antiporter subunit E [Kaistia dalseonensis]MCX5495854.1 Na+/H+ antiporter subunit E [Kaistia dalseonensis]MDQ0438455.1 multicomponent Na+:H+ antiporter subunit E [Kaistia dalseonensis]
MSDPAETSLFSAAGAVRIVTFTLVWVVLTGAYLKDLPVGILTAFGAAWISLRLLPPGPSHPSILPAIRYVLRFVGQSIVAGIDVARRALAPDLPINPGFVTYRTKLPPGTARDAFCDTMSLLPGTVPAGTTDDGGVLIHGLDVSQPIIDDLAREEALFVETFDLARRK